MVDKASARIHLPCALIYAARFAVKAAMVTPNRQHCARSPRFRHHSLMPKHFETGRRTVDAACKQHV